LELRGLNPQQRAAVETLRGPVLVLAGAGTGKTRVITARVAHLIACGVSPTNILAVTFTNKAAREMQQRVHKLLAHGRARPEAAPPAPTLEPGTGEPAADPGGVAARPTICTFHSLCVRILRQHIDRLGYKRNFVIFSESEQLGALKKILSQIHAKGESADPHAILGLLSRYRNQGRQTSGLSARQPPTGRGPVAPFADPAVAAMAEHVRTRYESALRACNALDFDDLILLTLRLFDEHPDVLDACRARYRYVMVDEYQDTNAAQFQLVHALTRQHRNLCVVGDDDQSIYGWRGAEIANVLDFERYYPEVKVIQLEQNYRSTNTILTAANALIRHNARRRGKTLWSAHGPGQKILLHTFENEEAEARVIVEEIEAARLLRRVPWGDQAILFRTNAQARPLETALRQAGVRYHLIGGPSFFDRREIKDLLAYCKVFLNPHDDVSLLRIANVPPRGLSDATTQRLLAASQERQCSVFAAMKTPAVAAMVPGRARECLEAFVQFIERTRTGLMLSPPVGHPRPLQRWCEQFLDELDYWTELRRTEKDPETADNRLRNLRDLIATMDDDCPPALGGAPLAERLQRFLDHLALDRERDPDPDPRGDAVTLITMHSCKGLEFPHVHVVGLEEGLLPHARAKAEGTLDEERRLFYVAITRAMQTLTLSHCAARKKFGQLTPCHPSRFLQELPAELIERAEDRASAPVSAADAKELFAAVRTAVG
jgi:superfamily I DNA/RNA helicase